MGVGLCEGKFGGWLVVGHAVARGPRPGPRTSRLGSGGAPPVPPRRPPGPRVTETRGRVLLGLVRKRVSGGKTQQATISRRLSEQLGPLSGFCEDTTGFCVRASRVVLCSSGVSCNLVPQHHMAVGYHGDVLRARNCCGKLSTRRAKRSKVGVTHDI